MRKWLLGFLLLLGSTGPLAAQTMSVFQTGFEAPGGNPRAIAMADFNGDGFLDFATANYSTPNGLSVFLGRGDGEFYVSAQLSLPVGPFGIVAADFNHDGRADLAVTSADSSEISILEWQSTGFVVTATLKSPGGDPRFIVAADFDRDGRPDIAYTSFSCGCVEVWLSPDRFRPNWTMVGSFATGQGAHGLAIGDFDRDGVVDLIATNAIDNSARILYGVGDGNFLAGPTVATEGTPRSVAVGDFNHDGLLDFAVANTTSNSISIFLGTPVVPPSTDGTPVVQQFSGRTLSGLPIASPRDIAAVDLNGDGNLDLVVASFGNNSVVVLTGDSTGHFGATDANLYTVVIPTQSGPRTLALADFNQTGRASIVCGDQTSGSVSIIVNVTVLPKHFR